MEMQLLDVDYVMLENRPVIRLWGKMADGQAVCAFYNGFLPYFFVDKSPADVLGDSVLVERVDKVPLVVGTTATASKRGVWKVTISNPADVPDTRQRAERAGLTCYEADVLFKYRFMADMGLAGFGWVKIDNGRAVSTTAVRPAAVEAKGVAPVERADDVQLKMLAFDIECVADGERVPDARRDPIVLISVAFDQPWQGKYTIVLSTRAGEGVRAVEDEAELIKAFFDIINDYDPDIITGYNCNNFDLPYILERAAKLDVRPTFGRCGHKSVVARKVGIRWRVSVPGRVVVDSYEIIRKDFFLQRYGLDFVAEKLLGEKKPNIRYSQIAQLWRGGQDGFGRLIAYSEKDAWLALELLKRLNLVDKYIALSKVAGTLLQDTIDGGETIRIEQHVLREFNRAGYVLPCRPAPDEVEQRRAQTLGGGEVFEPVKGLHSNIAVLDFKSMYPSIICAFNICPSTITDRGGLETPSGAHFLSKEVREGVIPHIERRLMEERQAVKRKLKKIKDGQLSRTLWLHQWALKILANAFYGYFGYARSRLYDPRIANAITSSGRAIILRTKQFIEEQLGRRVVYGDTDSLFVQLASTEFEQQVDEARQIVEQAAAQLPYGMEMEFEKIFRRFLPLTKKRYAALAIIPGDEGNEQIIETKGIETVRRDWCNLVGITVKAVLEILLRQTDIKAAVHYFKTVTEQLLAGQIPIQNLVITKTITKAPRAYAGVQPHIELAKKIQSRSPGEAPGIGDRIGYVIIKGSPNTMLSKRAEDPGYAAEKGLSVDSNYYIVNQLLPPIERIFKSLGISKAELLGNGRQMGLLDMLPKSRFVCSHCGRDWPRPPLSGLCECGVAF